MDAEVRLLDYDDAGDTVGLEKVFMSGEDCSASDLGCFLHSLTEFFAFVERVKISLEELSDDVATKIAAGGEVLSSFHNICNIRILSVFFAFHLSVFL